LYCNYICQIFWEKFIDKYIAKSIKIFPCQVGVDIFSPKSHAARPGPSGLTTPGSPPPSNLALPPTGPRLASRPVPSRDESIDTGTRTRTPAPRDASTRHKPLATSRFVYFYTAPARRDEAFSSFFLLRSLAEPSRAEPRAPPREESKR
jgi:hypothetical protein